MRNYIEYLQGGNYIYYQKLDRRVTNTPKDENGNPKEEIPNTGSAGYIPGLIWYLLNKSKLNEKTSDKVSKNISSPNRNVGNSYVVNIPAGVADTVITGPNFSVTASTRIKSGTQLL